VRDHERIDGIATSNLSPDVVEQNACPPEAA